ncbi:unnamed protein product [Blepharisma stoltei]|uniref:Ig-like domain-containing protein n=1 Tax=Blepharisma stoltei TaxID=1481888 RepID=A0AAU9IB54_9CILI|nr:unnamed protein product [Blepharisma stoltei]
MKSLISFLALIWLAMGDPTRTAKDGYLDPGKIRWWKDSWAPNPIELSQTNSGTSSGVTVTVNFRPQTSLPTTGNMGIVIVTVPSTFSTQITYPSSSMAIKANTDTSFSFSLATALPSAGVYGPFQIVTKTSTGGQIYDANYVFGCVAVSASVSSASANSLTVNAVTLTTNTAIVGSSDGLYFSFTIPAGTNLWKHDIFEIVPDTHWTIPSSPTCASVDISGTTNYIKGPKGDNSLPCAIAASGGANGGYNTAKSAATPATNSIYIYGLSQDVLITSSYQIKLQVSSFTLPLSAVSTSNFSWNLKIWRWGTTNLLAQYAGTGPLTPVAGAVTISSWVPYNTNLASTDIPNSSSNSFYLFTKLTFQTAHAITYGTIVITFNSYADISSGYWWQDHASTSVDTRANCYLNTYVKGITCSVASTKATITIADKVTLAANTAISITLLTKLTSGAAISSIITTDSTTSANIDQITSTTSWSFNTAASTYVPMTSFQFFATATNSIPTGGTLTLGEQKGGYTGSQYLMWYMTPKNDWSASTTLKVSLPFSSSGVQLLNSYITTSATYKEKILQSSDYASAAVALDANINTPTLSAGNPGSISIAFKATGFPTTSSKNMFAFSYGDNSGASAQDSLPFVASNVATFYECWAKTSSTTNGAVTEFSNYVFSVITSQSDAELKVASLCNDNYAGIPIAVVFHALNMKFNFGDTTNLYYLDVTFTDSLGSSNLGTGATGKETIPVASAATGATATLDPTSKTVTISGLGSVDTNAKVSVYLPYGGDITTSYATTQTFYYLVAGADPANKMVLYTGTGGSTFTSSGEVKFSSGSFTSPASGSYTIGGTSVSTTLSVTPASSITSNVNSGWIGVGLPAGFTSSSTKLNLGSNSANLYSAASSSSSFKGGFMIAPLSSSMVVTQGAANTLSMDQGLNVPSSTGLESGAGSGTLTVFIAGSTIGNACTCASQSSPITVSINPATITADSCTLDKPFAQGSDSVDSTLTLTFTTVNPIPAGGKITITLASSAWTLKSSDPLFSTCQGVGFTDQSKTLQQSCNASGTTVTLTKFSQIAAGSVSVKLNHVIPTSTAAGSINCFTAVTTYDAKGYVIDSASSLTKSVDVAVSTGAGTTNTNSFVSKPYPNVAGATADIYLTFSLSKAVPQYGIISITPGFVSSLALSSGDVSSSCWTDIDYYSCKVSGTSISIQLSNSLAANTAMKVYLDMALVLPTSNSTTTGWTISSTWGEVSITADSTSASPATFPQTVGAAVNSAITLSSVAAVNSQTADETTSYTFTFTSAVVVATSDSFVIEFPKDFSPLLGLASAVFPDCSPNNFYTTCSSTALGISSGTYCSVDHWKLTVTGITKATTATTASIDITVDGIQNPAAGTTTGKFSLYQYGSDGSVKAYIQKATAATITSLASTMVSLKAATVDTTTLSKSATYTFDFYLSASTTFTTDHVISIYFPSQFNNKLRNGSTVPCKSVYYDESSSSSSTTTSQTLSSATSCSVSGSNVSLNFPSSLTTATATTSRIQLQLTGFYNPESGISRTAGWDISDYSTFSSTKFDRYSNKFSIAISQSSKTQIYAESWPNLNSAYIGYTVGYGSSYSTSSTASSSKISLLPGTQSTDQTISILDSNSWPMKSKSFKLSPTSNANYPDSGNLKYTSAFHAFTVYQMTPQFNFRVAAKSSAATGIYYIDWGTPTEKLQDGVTNSLYVAPLSTMIEVCSSLTPATVTVDTLPTLYKYYTSIPIKVSLANAPASQLTVTPTFSVTGFTVTPTSLTFGPDVNALYFQVNVGSAYSASATSPTVSFTLGGTDAAAFTAPSKQTVTVSTSYPSIVTATPGLSITKVSASEVKVAVTSTIAGVLYWGLGCQGSQVLTFAGLSALVSDLVTPSKTIQTLQEQLSHQYQNTETDINTSKKDTDINSFFRRIHSEHCSDYWASSQVITTAGATIDFNWLMAGTSYTFSAYIATRLTNNTGAYPLNTYNFTTDAAGQYYSTAVTFSGSVLSSSSSSIAKVLAKNMGVNPSWLTYVSSTRRMLQGTSSTTTFTYNVLSDSRYPAYTSSAMISNLNTNQAQATSDFSSTLSLTATSLGTSTAVSTGTTPTWSTAPAKTASTDTSATFTAASSQAGTIYVSCTDNDLTGRITYAWQVTNGLDATTEKVPSANVASVAATSETLTVTGLSAGTSYACYFTACNSYPVTPSCIDYSSNNPLKSISFKTSGSSGSDSSAVMMGASALLAFILTLLN